MNNNCVLVRNSVRIWLHINTNDENCIFIIYEETYNFNHEYLK